MTSPLMSDPTMRALAYALDGLALRQKTTANNIANIDTPDYKAQRVSFESQLQAALDGSESDNSLPMTTTNQRHISLGHAPFDPRTMAVQQDNSSLRNDGNNVDIDLEMTTLAETSLRYQALTQLSGMKISLLKNIVRESS